MALARKAHSDCGGTARHITRARPPRVIRGLSLKYLRNSGEPVALCGPRAILTRNHGLSVVSAASAKLRPALPDRRPHPRLTSEAQGAALTACVARIATRVGEGVECDRSLGLGSVPQIAAFSHRPSEGSDPRSTAIVLDELMPSVAP